jgi:hypothetical protein
LLYFVAEGEEWDGIGVVALAQSVEATRRVCELWGLYEFLKRNLVRESV